MGGESRGESGKSRGRVEAEAVQKCKSAEGLCKGGKVEPEYRGRSTEYRGRSTESKKGDGEGRQCKGANQPSGCAKVERLIPKQSTEYRVQSTEYGGKVGAWLRRDLVCIGVQGGALPLPEPEPFPIRQTLTAIRQSWHAVPTLPEAVRTCVDWRTDATQSRPYPRQLG